MFQTQSLPERSIYDSPIQQALTPPPSPYSRRLPHQSKFKYDREEIDVERAGFVPIEFDSPRGSPYSRRYPASQRRYRNGNKENLIETSSLSEREDFEATDIQDYSLPIEMHRYQSMQSLRHRRDPHYQGIRSRKAKRVINKTGERNIGFSNIPQRSWMFCKDFVTTLIDEQWRYVITVFALSFFLCWILFAILWYLIAHAHGDLNFDPVTGERLNDGPVPCVEGAKNFVGYLLFSIETQVSIGYGTKYPNEECPEAIFLMVVQIVTGIAIEGAMVGIVYAKMIRPPRHAFDMKFSKKAVVCQRDSNLCLVFRVCDTKQLHVVDSRIKAYWFEERLSMEGELLQQFEYSLKLENNGLLFLIFPTTVSHVIDETSPLYDFSAKDLLEKKFEIVITLTGASRSTGQMTQSRTSYLPKEIFWGHRFVNMVRYDRVHDVYTTDFDQFDETEEIDTPLCSARRFKEVQDEVHEYFENELPPDYYTHNIINELKENIASSDEQHSGISGNEQYSSHKHIYQNNANETTQMMTDRLQMEKLVEELEIKLSRHSLNLAKERKEEITDKLSG